MAQSFASFAAFAAYLEGIARTAPYAERAGLNKASEHMLEAIQKIPGVYQGGWEELADRTKKDRIKRGFSENDPLLRSGELKKSYFRRVINTRHAKVGSGDPRAPWFETGTRYMPPRPVIGTAVAKEGKNCSSIIGDRMHKHLITGTVGE